MKFPLQQLLTLFTEYDPEATAKVSGSPHYPELTGTVLFYPFWKGTLVVALISGLPTPDAPCSDSFFGFHVHAGKECSGTPENPFANAGMHYNPENCPHPEHAGDLPPLISNGGLAFQTFYTERFRPGDIIGRTVIVHLNPDDFHTQPSGNSGTMIGCGEIKKF